jgi:hypothetical protein
VICLNTEKFIQKAIKEHGNMYDYSKVVYTKSNEHVIIICPVHGDFTQIANGHLMGARCTTCYGRKKRTQEDFLRIAHEKHGDRYDYSKSLYKSGVSKVTIICRIHGDFQQGASNHLIGQGCKKCTKRQYPYTTEEFIAKAMSRHGNLYSYGKTEYIKTNVNITITCREHGDFEQNPRNHLSGQGCKKCYLENHSSKK